MKNRLTTLLSVSFVCTPRTVSHYTDLYVNFVYLQILLATRHFSTIFVKLSSLDVFNGIFKKKFDIKINLHSYC